MKGDGRMGSGNITGVVRRACEVQVNGVVAWKPKLEIQRRILHPSLSLLADVQSIRRMKTKMSDIAELATTSEELMWEKVFNPAYAGALCTGAALYDKFTIPQRFFLHFYVVAAVWTMLLLILTWFYAYRTAPLASESFHYSTVASHLIGGSHMFSIHKPKTPVQQRYQIWLSVYLLILMEVQVLRRLYETIYVFNYSSSARMHIFGYLTGLFFYTAAPLSLASSCATEALRYTAGQVVEFIVRGRDRMPVTEFDWWGFVMPITNIGWLQWIGAAIFLWGWIHQYRCHAILGSLRERAEHTEEYAIPYGDWFEIVSCPHYLAEIIIYAGLLVASGGADITLWLLFAFVVTNLTFAAAETQRWYLRKFDDYPRSRRAIIPYVY